MHSLHAEVRGALNVVIDDARVRESDSELLRFQVALNREALRQVEVDYATMDGTATAGSDYTSTSGTLTFAVGDRIKHVEVPVTVDSNNEGDETMIRQALEPDQRPVADPRAQERHRDDLERRPGPRRAGRPLRP